jgi:hypothetical protein
MGGDRLSICCASLPCDKVKCLPWETQINRIELQKHDKRRIDNPSLNILLMETRWIVKGKLKLMYKENSIDQ